VPAATGGTPTLSFDEALRLSSSELAAEFNLGPRVLFRRYPNKLETWDAIVNTVKSQPSSHVPPHVVYWLAHIPWHADLGYFGEALAPGTVAYAKSLLSQFGEPEILALLSFIDPEGQISRGAIGQSVEGAH
jgi:hypothetical protein